MKINGVDIPTGAETRVDIEIASLPSGTQVSIPVIISRSEKPGPSMLLMAGLHGDEINGVEIVRQIIEKGWHQPDFGTIITIPILNVFGFNNFSREVVNGKDVNRSFPGSKSGSLASQVAYVMMNKIIPHIDFGLDIHTGGSARTNFPQIRTTINDLVNVQLAEAFNPTFIIDSPFIKGSLRHAAAKAGKRILVFEGGESLRFDQASIKDAIRGYKALCTKMKLRKFSNLSKNKRLYIKKKKWLRAEGSGFFIPKVKSGGKIEEDQLIGHIKNPLGNEQVEIRSPLEGYIIGINNNPIVNQGDPLLHVGIQWSQRL